MGAEPRPLLRLRAVTKRYAERVALDRVTLAVAPGRLLAVVGPSGAGKTTLLNLLLGWEAPDEGVVERDPSVAPGPDGLVPWRAVTVVPQQRGLLADLSLLDNVRLPHRLAREADEGRAEAVLAGLALDRLAHRFPHEVSLGEQQRASVARALVVGPAVVLADEPTAHQDAGAASVVLGALRGAVDAGAACVVVTHDATVLRHADVVVEAVSGRFTVLPEAG